MELTRKNWTKKDIKSFQEYLIQFENPEKKNWAKNLLNTNLPVLCIKTKDMKDIINKISNGNYLEFLDLMIWEYYENTAINGFLICKITEFNIFKKYLDTYSNLCDNWATCDLLTFNIKGYENEYFELSKSYIKSNKTFKRRIGLYILFNYLDKEEYICEILNILNSMCEETEYYVNMMIAWLLSELFIKQREKTLDFFKNNKLKKFTINKAIQKCKESRRVSLNDKEMLNKYKISLKESK